MNIISSNCCSGYFYRLLNQKAENPFIWSFHTYKDFKELYTKYNIIKFDNVKFNLTENKTVKCEIDNTFIQNYNHYFYDENCNEPVIKNNCVFYKDILEYCKTKYFIRLARMKELPVFIIQWLNQNGFTKDTLNEFLALNHNYKTVIITGEADNYVMNNIVKIINHKNANIFEKSNLIEFLTLYKDEIMKFIL